MSLRGALIPVGRSSFHRSIFHNQSLDAFITTRRYLSSLETLSRQRIEALVHKLHKSVWTNHLADIHKCYPVLVEDVQKVKTASPSILNREQLRDLLDILAASGRSFDLALIERILSDMPDVFSLQPTPDDHTAVIRALIRSGNVQTIHRWLVTMPQKPGHINPSLQQWHLFLEYCREKGEAGIIRVAIKTMRKSGCRPTNASFKILIEALFETSSPVPHVNVFSSVMDDMMKEGLRYDPAIAASLHLWYSKLGHNRRASQVERLYHSRFMNPKEGRKEEPKWNNRLRNEAEKHGTRAAVNLCKIYQQKGTVSSHLALLTILRNSSNLNDLRYAETELGVQANVVHWSILINNAVRSGDVTMALSIYTHAQKSGIRPDAAMVHPIISALCRTTIKPPSEAAIDQALILYQDLANTDPFDESNTSQGTSATGPNHSPGPDANIYNSLLRALSSSANVSKCYPLAMSLLDDMQARNISMGDSMTTTSLTILLMRKSSDLSQAFDIYRRICTTEGSVVDAEGYTVLLNAFCKLSLARHPLPSLRYYFEMVKDMRNAGHSLTVEVYTILLRQLASLVTRMTNHEYPPTFRDDLIAAIRRVHNHLTVDASISPDPPLWNQLMDTYQRAGCFEEACKIWDMVYLSGRFDNASVSIILDACGFAGAWHVAKQIYSTLLGDGFSFNQRNWYAWVECLCRLGKLNQAVKMVCLEMGKHQDDVAPDVETVRILLKFASETKQQNEVQSRIRQYLPKLWETLPRELQQPF